MADDDFSAGSTKPDDRGTVGAAGMSRGDVPAASL
ncbi:MAG: hypothetical protein JWO86_7414 [Myxococcaceae bacterium]|nr:hypothetical protein [Myxococcaceae bacterium]